MLFVISFYIVHLFLLCVKHALHAVIFCVRDMNESVCSLMNMAPSIIIRTLNDFWMEQRKFLCNYFMDGKLHAFSTHLHPFHELFGSSQRIFTSQNSIVAQFCGYWHSAQCTVLFYIQRMSIVRVITIIVCPRDAEK